MPDMKRLSVVLFVIEDSDEDFDTVLEALQQTGIAAEVKRATSGGDGMTLLQSEMHNRPAIVLMDLNTPGTDGRQAVEEIKTDPELRAVPVVILSTSANPKDLAFCYAAGANACHVKPVRHPDHVAVLVDLLTYWLGHVILPASSEVHHT